MSRVAWIRVVLFVFAVGCAAWIAHLDFGDRITTNVLELMPAGDRDPELSVIRTLASEKQARMVLAAVVGGEATSNPELDEAAAWLTERMAGDAQFEQVTRLDSAASFTSVGEYLYAHRFELGLAAKLDAWETQWKAEAPAEDFSTWIASRAANDLDALLARPEALVAPDWVERDPLLLLLPAIELVAQSQDAHIPASHARLIWALQRTSPLEEAGQLPIVRTLEEWESELHKVHPSLQLQWTGLSRFAARNRVRIEHDLGWLNSLSLAGVASIALLGIAHIRRAWHLIPPVLLGTMGAWVVTTVVFPHVHILVLVLGALLSGVAVDYGFYLFVQPRANAEESYGAKVRRLRAPLLGSALTTVLGFLLLCWSELPFLQQLGVFVSSGLLFSLGGALLWFAQVRVHTLPVRTIVTRQLSLAPHRRSIVLLGSVIAVLAAVGMTRIQWRDDLRLLQVPSEDLRENDRRLRRWMGDEEGRQLLLSFGSNFTEARAAWDRLAAALGTPGELVSLARLLPSANAYDQLPQRLQRASDFPSRFRGELEARGYDAQLIDAALAGWPEPGSKRVDYEAAVSAFAHHLSGPLALLVGSNDERAWFVSVAPRLPGALPAGTIRVSQLESLNELFGRYRGSAVKLGWIGLSVLFGSVLLMYGLRRGIVVFLVPLGAMALTFGLLGWTGYNLNLFNLLGAFLGVCLSHNYAIFTTENRLRRESFPPSVRLSALAAAVSFGVLTLSSVPMVKSLGLTVAVIVVLAWWISEILFSILAESAAKRDTSHA